MTSLTWPRSSLFVAVAHQLFVVKTASSIWASTLLRCHNAVLGKVIDNIRFELFMKFWNTFKLFLLGAVERAAEKLGHFLRRL